MPSFLIETLVFLFLIVTVPIWVPLAMVLGIITIITLLVMAMIPFVKSAWHSLVAWLKGIF